MHGEDLVVLLHTQKRPQQLVRQIMQLPAIIVIEHPDMFVQHSEYTIDDFDYIIELRHHPDEEITYEVLERNNSFLQDSDGFGGFGGFNF